MSDKIKSRYSPNKDITKVQYVIELVCENKAKKDQKELPIKFWELPEWSKFYKSQLRACHKLSKKHGIDKLISYMKHKKIIWNLLAKWIDDDILKYKYTPPILKEETKTRDNADSLGVTRNKKTILDELDDF